MVQPIYTIDLLDTVDLTMVEQISSVGQQGWGASAVNERIGQTFLTIAAGKIFKVSVELKKLGNPTDAVKMKIYQSDKSTLVATSLNEIAGADISASTAAIFTFVFNHVSLLDATTYFIELSRTGSVHPTNIFQIGVSTANPYAGGSYWTYNSGTPIWTETSTWDMRFVVQTRDTEAIEITSDVRSIQNINTGLNGVYGSIKQGQALLTIKNINSKYSLLNTSSPIFNQFRLNNQIKIEVEYDFITYNLFQGFIDNIDPRLNFDERFVDVKLLDRFSEMKDITVSIGTQVSKTASELVELLLKAAFFIPSEYNVETDIEPLQDVTWDDVNLVEKLNEIVEAGQHYHFIDGNGVYQFKTNQFLSSNTPDFLYNDTNNDPGEVTQNYALSDIKNFIEVEYTGSNFEESKDTESQNLFGIRPLHLGNDLIDNQSYAGFIGDYILSLQKDAGNIIGIDLFLMLPDVFKIDFGTIIKLTDAFHSIDNVYNVLERTFSRPSAGQESLKIKARKFVFPPEDGLITLEPFQDDADITIPVPSNFLSFLQGFKVVNDGAIVTMTYKIDLVSTDTTIFLPIILELNASGFPTGPPVATGNIINLPSPGFTGAVEFEFPTLERPTLDSTKTYGVIITRSILFAAPTSLKVRGKTTDVYANGKPAYSEIGGPWTTLHPNDFYFKALIREV